MIKSFFRDSLLYTLANLCTRGVGFIMLPIYTRVISKEEYGIFDYLTTIGLLLGVIVTLEVTQAIFRFIPEYKNNHIKQTQLASTGFWFSVLMYLFLCAFSFIFADGLAILLLDDVRYSYLIIIVSILFLGNAILYNFTSLMRAQLLSKQVVIVSLLNAIFTACFSLLLVVYYKQGVQGLVVGQLLGVSLSAVVAYAVIKHWVQFTFCISSLKEMLAFSAPLILSSIGVVLSMFIDRVMLKEFLGVEQLASYAVAIKIASIVTLLMVGFQSALTPLIYANYEQEDTPKKIATLFHGYLFACLFGVFALIGVSNGLVGLVAGEQYLDAADYIPPLVFSALLSSMYLFFPGLSLAKKTFIIAAINVFAGTLNVMLNYIFIPKFGALGAAFSTLCSVFLAGVINAIVAQRFYSIPIHKPLTLLVFSLLCAVVYSVS